MHPDEPRSTDEPADDILALLRTLDHPAPPVTAAAIAARARAQRPPAAGPAFRWAAAIVLTLGAAGVALAAPGSPVLRWVEALADRWGLAGPPAQVAVPAPPPERAGIALAPGQRLVMVLVPSPGGGVARVSLADVAEVEVRAPAVSTTFTSGPGQLTIELRGPADTLDVDIPRAAARVELVVGGRRVLVAERGRITTAVPPDSTGRYRLALPPSRAP